MIGIIDYGMGNVGSIRNMLRKLGHDSAIMSDPRELVAADKLILPGVGAFDNGMRRLQDTGIREVIEQKVIDDKIAILGICLGMQLMLDGSDEGQLSGLSWVSGRAVRFEFPSVDRSYPVPHMGWNHIKTAEQHRLLDGLDERSRFYFVHSFRVATKNPENVLTTTRYGGLEFVSALHKGHIIGVQFHPEKSHRFGMQLLDNFAKLV